MKFPVGHQFFQHPRCQLWLVCRSLTHLDDYILVYRANDIDLLIWVQCSPLVTSRGGVRARNHQVLIIDMVNLSWHRNKLDDEILHCRWFQATVEYVVGCTTHPMIKNTISTSKQSDNKSWSIISNYTWVWQTDNRCDQIIKNGWLGCCFPLCVEIPGKCLRCVREIIFLVTKKSNG